VKRDPGPQFSRITLHVSFGVAQKPVEKQWFGD
jgi:hypothetical protein